MSSAHDVIFPLQFQFEDTRKDIDVAFARNFDLLCSDKCISMLSTMALHSIICILQAVLQRSSVVGKT